MPRFDNVTIVIRAWWKCADFLKTVQTYLQNLQYKVHTSQYRISLSLTPKRRLLTSLFERC